MKNRLAFTLAEVLITLGIIGVVAAMTIPSLVNYYKESSYLNQFKKSFSAISQAYLSASIDNGIANDWTDAEAAYNLLKPYFKIATDCGFTTPCSRPWGTWLKDINGTVFADPSLGRYHFILADGTALRIVQTDISAAGGGGSILRTRFDDGIKTLYLVFDTNGLKEPNQLGYDVFFLTLASRAGAPVVVGGFTMWWAEDKSLCKKGVTGWYPGGSCAYWIYRKWNMDYLHRDLTDAEWWD